MNIRKLSLIVLALSANAWAQDDGLKIFISADMEGVVGAVTAEQLRPGGFEYERFRGFMTAEVNAAIEAAYEVIRTRTAAAISRIGDFEPYVLETPIVMELSLKHYQPVELLGYLPNVERIDSHTIRYTGEDIREVSNFLIFVTSYRIDLQP